MRKLTLLLLLLSIGSLSVFAAGPDCDGEDLVRKAQLIVDETAKQHYSGQETDRKASIAEILPQPDANNVIITFTVDELNKIHVLDVKGGYAYINVYIKSSLEGKAIKAESALPGIQYVMAIKLPASA